MQIYAVLTFSLFFTPSWIYVLPTGIIFLLPEEFSLGNYHSVSISRNVFILPSFSGIFHRLYNYKLHLFSILKMSCHCEKSAVSLFAVLLKVSHFNPLLLNCSLDFRFSHPLLAYPGSTMMYQRNDFLCIYPTWDIEYFLNLKLNVFYLLGNFLAVIFRYSFHLILSSPSRITFTC